MGLGRLCGPWFAGKARKAFVWASIGKVVTQGGQLVQMAVLARLLTPEDFGAIGIALLALGLLDALTQTGFDAALVQRRGRAEEYLGTALTVQLTRGIALAVVLWMGGPFVARLFRSFKVVEVTQILGVAVGLRGLVNPAVATLNRELEFRRIFLINLSETVASTIVGVALGFSLRDVRALAGSQVAGQVARVVCSYLVIPWSPRFGLQLAALQELGTFGRWVFAANIVVFSGLQADRLFIARALGDEALGRYLMAFRISELPVTTLTFVVSQVAFPVLSRLQARKPELAARYVRGFQFLLSVNGVVTAFIFGLAGPLVKILLGAQWMDVAAVLRILVLANFARSLLSFGGCLFYAAGRPHLNFVMNAVRFVVLGGLLYPSAREFGLVGAAGAVLVANCAMGVFYVRSVRSLLGLSLKKHFAPLVPTVDGGPGKIL